MKSIYYYDTDIGKITIAEEDGYITHVLFGNEKLHDSTVNETPLIKEAHIQIVEYLKGERSSFDLPLSPSGTEFQQRVWNALKAIPYGKTVTYKDIAKKVGNEKACRAVGMANNRNPISIIIPCHRVIGKNGKLIGYGGGLGIKEYLLKLESNNL
ncbi:MAG: methylated-DNA--[protein]-cysteine S-methyltransferase [Tissierellia bacterium]|mgnify:CR=1 FL=1|jgi:methylated-DNA-[protein]-cysteine S-methyltransferase|nr:methylated-DNA--[protein]-cysteine S-methyltransferase [Tissierellia bacterium]